MSARSPLSHTGKADSLSGKERSKMDSVSIQIADTPEKFRPMAEEAVPPLLALLEKRNELER